MNDSSSGAGQNTSNTTFHGRPPSHNDSQYYDDILDDPAVSHFLEWGLRGSEGRGLAVNEVLPWVAGALSVLLLGACFIARRYHRRLRQMQAEKQRLEYDLRLMSNEHGLIRSHHRDLDDSPSTQQTLDLRNEIAIALTQVSVMETSSRAELPHTTLEPLRPRAQHPAQLPPQPVPPRMMISTVAPSDGTASELEVITDTHPLCSRAFAGAGYPLLPEFAQEVSDIRSGG